MVQAASEMRLTGPAGGHRDTFRLHSCDRRERKARCPHSSFGAPCQSLFDASPETYRVTRYARVQPTDRTIRIPPATISHRRSYHMSEIVWSGDWYSAA